MIPFEIDLGKWLRSDPENSRRQVNKVIAWKRERERGLEFKVNKQFKKALRNQVFLKFTVFDSSSTCGDIEKETPILVFATDHIWQIQSSPDFPPIYSFWCHIEFHRRNFSFWFQNFVEQAFNNPQNETGNLIFLNCKTPFYRFEIWSHSNMFYFNS